MFGGHAQHFGNIDVAVGQNARFSAPCARCHAYVAFRCADRLRLLRVQVFKDKFLYPHKSSFF